MTDRDPTSGSTTTSPPRRIIDCRRPRRTGLGSTRRRSRVGCDQPSTSRYPGRGSRRHQLGGGRASAGPTSTRPSSRVLGTPSCLPIPPPDGIGARLLTASRTRHRRPVIAGLRCRLVRAEHGRSGSRSCDPARFHEYETRGRRPPRRAARLGVTRRRSTRRTGIDITTLAERPDLVAGRPRASRVEALPDIPGGDVPTRPATRRSGPATSTGRRSRPRPSSSRPNSAPTGRRLRQPDLLPGRTACRPGTT